MSRRKRKNKPISPEENERIYKLCLAMERDRLRAYAKTRQGKFETHQILHYDAQSEEAMERDCTTSWLSDHCKGAAVIRRCGKPAKADVMRRREAAAIKRVRRNAPHLLPVIRLILKNGSNRDKSICEIMAKFGTPKK